MWFGGSAYGASAPPDQSQNATSRRPPGSTSRGPATPPPWSGNPGLTTLIGLQVFPPSRDFIAVGPTGTVYLTWDFGLRLRPKSHVRYTVPVGPTAMKS